jgi:hypothetical protein
MTVLYQKIYVLIVPVCRNVPINWLSHKTKTVGSAGGDKIQAREKLQCRGTRSEIAGLASEGRGLR